MNSSIDQDPNRTLTLILYVLYIVAIFTGGLLAVIALIINYVKRSDVQGSIFATTLHGKSEHSGGIWLGILLPFCRLFSCSLQVKILTCLQGLPFHRPYSVWV